jgi:hypothetical protein
MSPAPDAINLRAAIAALACCQAEHDGYDLGRVGKMPDPCFVDGHSGDFDTFPQFGDEFVVKPARARRKNPIRIATQPLPTSLAARSCALVITLIVKRAVDDIF